MSDYSELIRLKYAIQSFRERTIAEANAIEALIDAALPDDPGPGIRVPQGKKARKEYWKKNGIRAGLASHCRRVSPRRKQ